MRITLLMTVESNDEKMAMVREIVPRTLRSLYLMRICLCILALLTALLKINLSPPLAGFYTYIFTDGTTNMAAWLNACSVVVAGLLAICLALIISTFFIQARIKAQVDKDLGEPSSAL